MGRFRLPLPSYFKVDAVPATAEPRADKNSDRKARSVYAEAQSVRAAGSADGLVPHQRWRFADERAALEPSVLPESKVSRTSRLWLCGYAPTSRSVRSEVNEPRRSGDRYLLGSIKREVPK